jgi:hypothetical protein
MQSMSHTIEKELADLKAKHDAAVVGRSAALNAVSTADAARAQVEAAMKAIGGRILMQCKSIKAVCSGFNIVDELNNQVCWHRPLKLPPADIARSVSPLSENID